MLDLFLVVQRDGERALQSVVDARTQETVTLDFKTKQDRTHGRFGKEDKAVFGKALSGFANSAGGILIWGVDARKADDGVDCAQELSPIADIERFTSEAQTLVGQLLIPRHDGIQIVGIPSETVRGSGYLMVMVERSERRPHRSEAAGEKQYFKRAGDNTFAMEHYDIEDAFKRAGAPALRFVIDRSLGKPQTTVDLEQGLTSSTAVSIYYDIFIFNVGTAVAKHIYVNVAGPINLNASIVLESQFSPSIRTFKDGDQTYYVGTSDLVLHPGQRLRFLRLVIRYMRNWRGRAVIGDGKSGQQDYAHCDLRAGAENARETVQTIDTNSQELAIFLAENRLSL